MSKKKSSIKNQDENSWTAFDVVCGMELSMGDVKYAFEHEGKEYYFCSKTCKGHFIDDPERYAVEN